MKEQKKKPKKLSKLQKQEQKLMDQVDDLGLIRHVSHEYFGAGKSVKSDHSVVWISHETCVELYNANNWVNIMKGKREGTVDQYPRELLEPVGIGFARCSVKDNFNRRVGRVIATSRAISSFLNSEHLNK